MLISLILSCNPEALATICALITSPEGKTTIEEYSASPTAPGCAIAGGNGFGEPGVTTVSYTHLTLPTIYSV